MRILEEDAPHVLFKVVLHGTRDGAVRGSLRAIAEAVTGEADAPPRDAEIVTHDALDLSLGRVNGVLVDLLLVTAPAEGVHPTARLLVLKQCDAVLFIADGRAPEEERARFAELRGHIETHGYSWAETCVVLQLEGLGEGAGAYADALGAADRTRVAVDPGHPAGVLDGVTAIARQLLPRAIAQLER